MESLLATVLSLLALTAAAQSFNKLDSLKAIVSSTEGEASTYFEIYRLLAISNNDSAFHYLEKARMLANNSDKKMGMLIHKAFGREFLRRGFYSMSQKESFEALKLALEMKDSAQIAGIYNNIALMAFYTHMYEKAVKFYEEGLRFAANTPVAETLKNNYGLSLYMIKNDEYKALGIYHELLQGTKDSVKLSMYHNNMGTTFLKLKNYDSAYKHIVTTLKITTARRDSARNLFNYKLIGQYYFQTGQYADAKRYFKQALSLHSKFGDSGLWTTIEVPELYNCMVEIYKKENNPDSVRWIKDFYINFLDNNLKVQRKNSAEFVLGNQENEMARLEQKQKQSRKNLVEYYSIALMILLSMGAYFIFSGKDRQRKYTPYISIVILILAFEFLLVVLDPFINKITNDEPLYDFTCNAILAFLIVPIQFWGESILKRFALEIRIQKIAEQDSK